MFRELRRKNKEIPMETCKEILKNEVRGVLSVLGDDDYPYGMPMNYWYDEENNDIYFHSGRMGSHRLDALRRHNKVSFCVCDQGYREEGEWALNISSVIVFGRIELIENVDTIIDVTTKLSHKFTQDEAFINDQIRRFARGTLLMKLKAEHICGKKVKEE